MDARGYKALGDWRPVAGFEGLYEVSNIGDVRRVGQASRSGNGRGGGARVGRVLAQHRVNGGYFVVQLWREGKPSRRLVSRLVAEAFIGTPPTLKHTVNHRNGVKADNAVGNLEWATSSENNQHAYDTGLRTRTIAAATAARRKPRRMVPCACGCGSNVETPDRKGRDRTFLNGHNRRAVAA
jgi:hypothetical protein